MEKVIMSKIYRIFAIALILLNTIFLYSCKGSAGYFKDVVDNKTLNSVLVDGIPLEHKGEIGINDNYSSSRLEISQGTMFAELNGSPEAKVNLKVEYLEFQPGDASITLEDGELKTSSKSGNPVAITRISGSIPEKLGLNLEIGTGSVKLNNLKGNQIVNIDTGTGSIILNGCSLDKLSANSGTGNVSLSACKINSAEIDTGTGDIILQNSQVGKREFNTGTGKVIDK